MKPFFENILIALKSLFGVSIEDEHTIDNHDSNEDAENIDAENDDLILPFMPSKKGWGEWAYEHRIGLFSTLCFGLSLLLMAESIRIRLEMNNTFQGMEIEMPEEVVEEKKRGN